jgi:hypothetical protein
MKKVAFLCLIMIIVGFVVVSCALKDKLQENTISVAIEPASVGFIRHNSLQNFTAIVRNTRGELIDVDVNWSISDFTGDVSISTNVGKRVIFTVGSSGGDSTGVLTAEYSGVSRSVNIEITNALYLYRNGVWGSTIDKDSLNNCLISPEYITMNEVLDANGTTCLEFGVSQPPVGTVPGFYLQFQPPQDLNTYRTLQFSARSSDGMGDITFITYSIGWEVNSTNNVGGDWGDISIDISGTLRSSVRDSFKITFSNSEISAAGRTLRINNIRFIE